jgi:hypothetical protein
MKRSRREQLLYLRIQSQQQNFTYFLSLLVNIE